MARSDLIDRVTVCLTFDDGPDPEWTPRILDALDGAGVTATFFVIGQRAAEYPELVGETQARGHSVQPHCWAHDRTHREMSRDEIVDDLRRTLTVLGDAGVTAPTHWRPPDGVIRTPDTRQVAAAHRLRLLLWHVDPQDWRPASTAPQMLAHLRDREVWSAGGDSVVLLHDGRVNTERTTAENTLGLVVPLVQYVRGRGWDLGPIRTPPLHRRLRAVVGRLRPRPR
jgi:peptidoglycan/xylan/chitin deacetylase (PgdA/CDA1 family)